MLNYILFNKQEIIGFFNFKDKIAELILSESILLIILNKKKLTKIKMDY